MLSPHVSKSFVFRRRRNIEIVFLNLLLKKERNPSYLKTQTHSKISIKFLEGSWQPDLSFVSHNKFKDRESMR